MDDMLETPGATRRSVLIKKGWGTAMQGNGEFTIVLRSTGHPAQSVGLNVTNNELDFVHVTDIYDPDSSLRIGRGTLVRKIHQHTRETAAQSAARSRLGTELL